MAGSLPIPEDDDSRQFPPSAVFQVIRRHDDEVSRALDSARKIVATYKTEAWKAESGDSKASSDGKNISGEMRTEVNRVWPVTTAMAAALYPNAARVALMPSYDGRGSAPKAQAALNDWGMKHTMQDRVLFGVTQCILTGAIGWHINYEAGTGRPTDRTYLTVVPRADMILDTSVTDTRFERYRGRIVWMPKQAAEAKYNVKGLTGTARTDPWSYGTVGASGGSGNGLGTETPDGMGGFGPSVKTGGPAGPDGDFVRVLEFYNRVDPLTTERGNVYRGRMEIYILDQEGDVYRKPIKVEAMPFASPSGEPIFPIIPLGFASDPIYPYRFFSALERMMPMQRELNVLASLRAIQFRRSAARKGIGRAGVLTSDQMTAFLNGDDAAIAMASEDYKGRLDDVAHWVDPPKVDPMLIEHAQAIDKEMTWVLAQAPNFRGEVTDATKYEVEAANKQTEIELAMYARKLYNSLAEAYAVALRSFIACMLDVTDSAGGFAPTGASTSRDVAANVHLDAVGAVTTKQVVDSAKDDAGAVDAMTTDAPDEAEARGTPMPAVAAPVSPEAVTASTPAPVVVERPFRVVVDGTASMVTRDDLDAQFEIEFLDGVRTPMREDEQKKITLNLAQPMLALWQQAQQKGPVGVFARVQMDTFVSSFGLPKSWSPAALDEATTHAEKAAAPVAPPEDVTVAASPGPALATPPSAPAPTSPPNAEAAVAQLHAADAALDVGDLQGAAKALVPLAALGPRVAQALEEAARSPDPASALRNVVQTLLRVFGRSAAPAAPAGPAAPPAESPELPQPPAPEA